MTVQDAAPHKGLTPETTECAAPNQTVNAASTRQQQPITCRQRRAKEETPRGASATSPALDTWSDTNTTRASQAPPLPNETDTNDTLSAATRVPRHAAASRRSSSPSPRCCPPRSTAPYGYRLPQPQPTFGTGRRQTAPSTERQNKHQPQHQHRYRPRWFEAAPAEGESAPAVPAHPSHRPTTTAPITITITIAITITSPTTTTATTNTTTTAADLDGGSSGHAPPMGACPCGAVRRALLPANPRPPDEASRPLSSEQPPWPPAKDPGHRRPLRSRRHRHQPTAVV